MLKKNPHLRKGVMVADDTDTLLPNADKNKKMSQSDHQKITLQINLLTNT